jgi:hypothetical protein
VGSYEVRMLKAIYAQGSRLKAESSKRLEAEKGQLPFFLNKPINK